MGGKLKWEDFMQHCLGESPGDILELDTGECIGRHRGLYFHTIGQRKGIGPVIDPKQHHRGPFYVAAKDAQSNTLYLTTKLEDWTDLRSKFSVDRVSWISGQPPTELTSLGSQAELFVQVRHAPRSRVQKATVELIDEEKGIFNIEFATPDHAGVAPGQYAAFYQGDRCLGAGIIRENQDRASWGMIQREHGNENREHEPLKEEIEMVPQGLKVRQ